MSTLVPKPRRSRNKEIPPKPSDKVFVGPDAADYAQEASTDLKARYQALEEGRNWFTWTAFPIFLVGVSAVWWVILLPCAVVAMIAIMGPGASTDERVGGIKVLFIVWFWLTIPVVLLAMFLARAGVAISGNNKFRMVVLGLGLLIAVSILRTTNWVSMEPIAILLTVAIVVGIVLVMRSFWGRRKAKARVARRPKNQQ